MPGEDARRRAPEYGFHSAAHSHDPAAASAAPYTAKPGSHDDGPRHGMFLGPVGGPAFSRDLEGRFSRWHLQPGTHLVTDLDAAFLAVHWRDEAGDHVYELRGGQFDRHETSALFPLAHEEFATPAVPFRVFLTSFSPVIPGDEEASGLPAVVFDVELVPALGFRHLPAVDVAMFWPNLNGWRASAVTTTARGDAAWPGHHHAGNHNVAADPGTSGAYVVQRRDTAVPDPADLTGEVCLSVTGDAETYSRQVQFKTDQNATGVPDHEQAYTLAAVRHAFATIGALGVTPDGSWPAHWHEPVGSAVAGHVDADRVRARLRFVLTFDWPLVRFGRGRAWWRAEAAARSRRAERVPDGLALARRAHSAADGWLDAVDSWHADVLADLTSRGWPEPVAGCVVNELGLATALGTTWVDGTAAGHEPPSPIGGSEHLGLLEGFDEGYFYYDTSDLWQYAFPALSLNWPRLAGVVFTDLADALAAEVTEERPVYRVAEHRPMLAADKLPHDLGAAPEDPFVALNGYVMRDDPNSWRDSNPAFVLATLLHHRLTGLTAGGETWERLRAAAEVTATQADEGAGVPRHEEFGDSTWDNLALRGYSTYTTALCAGMWAVLADESRRRGEPAGTYDLRLRSAREVLDTLWNGRFFRAASEGKYTDACMPDSTIGLFYAELCGAKHGVPEERVASHLRHAFEVAHRGHANGRVGPLLIASESVARHERDGGEELQVNEVIVGSAWMFAAMLMHCGLRAEAVDVASTLRDTLYGGTGLQFRTPAALDGRGAFRAPLNMRPLAAWWLAAVRPPDAPTDARAAAPRG